MRLRAVGFDLGETLIYFEGVPLSWVGLYRDALRAVGDACSVSVSDAQLDAAETVLRRFNGRLNPRTVEVTTEAVWLPLLDALETPPHHLPHASRRRN